MQVLEGEKWHHVGLDTDGGAGASSLTGLAAGVAAGDDVVDVNAAVSRHVRGESDA